VSKNFLGLLLGVCSVVARLDSTALGKDWAILPPDTSKLISSWSGNRGEEPYYGAREGESMSLPPLGKYQSPPREKPNLPILEADQSQDFIVDRRLLPYYQSQQAEAATVREDDFDPCASFVPDPTQVAEAEIQQLEAISEGALRSEAAYNTSGLRSQVYGNGENGVPIALDRFGHMVISPDNRTFILNIAGTNPEHGNILQNLKAWPVWSGGAWRHAGNVESAQKILPIVERIVGSEKARPTKIQINGHSQGAGIATALIPMFRKAFPGAQITANLFAPPVSESKPSRDPNVRIWRAGSSKDLVRTAKLPGIGLNTSDLTFNLTEPGDRAAPLKAHGIRGLAERLSRLICLKKRARDDEGPEIKRQQEQNRLGRIEAAAAA
jgi:hypothetical protein